MTVVTTGAADYRGRTVPAYVSIATIKIGRAHV